MDSNPQSPVGGLFVKLVENPLAPGHSDPIRTARRCTLTTLSRAASDEFPVLPARLVFN